MKTFQIEKAMKEPKKKKNVIVNPIYSHRSPAWNNDIKSPGMTGITVVYDDSHQIESIPTGFATRLSNHNLNLKPGNHLDPPRTRF